MYRKGVYMKNIALNATKIFSILLVVFTLIVVLTNTSTEPEEVEEVEEVVEAKPVDNKQLKCLAENIFYEARGESITGKAAVARVVMNRVNHGFASTPCNVIYQVTTVTKINEETLDEYKVRLCQFSWVCENRQKINVTTLNIYKQWILHIKC